MNWRNHKLLLAIRDLECQFTDLPHCCSGQVTACHSNQLRDGKGKGIKAHDFRVAAGCPIAHFAIDQGKELTREERMQYWESAHRRTMGELFKTFTIEVK